MDLVELYLHHSHSLATVQFVFASAILPGVCVSQEGNKFFVQLVLVDGTVYRAGYALPDLDGDLVCVCILFNILPQSLVS